MPSHRKVYGYQFISAWGKRFDRREITDFPSNLCVVLHLLFTVITVCFCL